MNDKQQYIVQNGDNLKTISAAFYGSPDMWTVIYNANRKQIPSPEKIYPGQVLVIP